MNGIYKSEIHGWKDSFEQVIIYPLADDDEFWRLDEYNHKARLEYFNLYEEPNPMPGKIYHRYSFTLTNFFMIIIETTACNL